MTQRPDQDDGPVTLINVFEVQAGDAEAFIAQWRKRARVMADAPGFRDTQLHVASSPAARFQFVNVAHWDSHEQLAAAQRSQEFQGSLRAALGDSQVRFTANPGTYTVAVAMTAAD
jgi:heme-degrading monooxygenase HmoA